MIYGRQIDKNDNYRNEFTPINWKTTIHILRNGWMHEYPFDYVIKNPRNCEKIELMNRGKSIRKREPVRELIK